ncbi:MAG: hypothetical protein JXB47_12795 [Anaerolineae bacterium]|nr:hypothetical protein [Anaerolineae bacterium]
MVHLPISATNYRIPDFVGPDYIADSKNVSGDFTNSLDQLQDFANAAATLGYSFWIYVRADTTPAPEHYEIARSTGGDVVHYFVGEDYHDGVDQAATIGVVASMAVAGGMIVLEIRVLWGSRRRPKRPPSEPRPRHDALGRAIQAVEDADEFKKRSKESGRRKAEIEDARED